MLPEWYGWDVPLNFQVSKLLSFWGLLQLCYGIRYPNHIPLKHHNIPLAGSNLSSISTMIIHILLLSGKLTVCYGKSPLFFGKINYKWRFSIAMLNYQRVEINISHLIPLAGQIRCRTMSTVWFSRKTLVFRWQPLGVQRMNCFSRYP